MIPFILTGLLGVTAVLLATKRAWGLVLMSGLLALLFLHVAIKPHVATTARHVVNQERP